MYPQLRTSLSKGDSVFPRSPHGLDGAQPDTIIQPYRICALHSHPLPCALSSTTYNKKPYACLELHLALLQAHLGSLSIPPRQPVLRRDLSFLGPSSSGLSRVSLTLTLNLTRPGPGPGPLTFCCSPSRTLHNTLNRSTYLSARHFAPSRHSSLAPAAIWQATPFPPVSARSVVVLAWGPLATSSFPFPIPGLWTSTPNLT